MDITTMTGWWSGRGKGSLSRRAFLAAALVGVSRWSGRGLTRPGSELLPPGFPDPAREWRGDSSVGAAVRASPLPAGSRAAPLWNPGDEPRPADRSVVERFLARFPHLRRHVVFEYYPWYEVDPYRHWDEAGRQPPDDIASNYMPALGPYDSRATRVMEHHARWIAETGIGAINVSWWGPGSRTDLIVHRLMDVMRAHDIHVTFHLEPYAHDRAVDYRRDVMYLLEEYGAKRHWDAFLLLPRADGTVGPVLKSFRTILPPTITDCLGRVWPVPDFTDDGDWRRQTDGLRRLFLHDFDHITLLADSLDTVRTGAAGFDGVAIYDNYVRPASWPGHAAACAARDLLFSFNINPGFDGIILRETEPDACYVAPSFEPPARPIDWADPAERERAARLGLDRVAESLATTVTLQATPGLPNARHGFFLVYVNSFNEWHEGHQFEPMVPVRDLTSVQRRYGYHNPEVGDARLRLLGDLLDPLFHDRELPRRPSDQSVASAAGSRCNLAAL